MVCMEIEDNGLGMSVAYFIIIENHGVRWMLNLALAQVQNLSFAFHLNDKRPINIPDLLFAIDATAKDSYPIYAINIYSQ